MQRAQSTLRIAFRWEMKWNCCVRHRIFGFAGMCCNDVTVPFRLVSLSNHSEKDRALEAFDRHACALCVSSIADILECVKNTSRSDRTKAKQNTQLVIKKRYGNNGRVPMNHSHIDAAPSINRTKSTRIHTSEHFVRCIINREPNVKLYCREAITR